MYKFICVTLTSLLAIAPAYSSDTFLLKLVDPLDEPEFYCLDVTGWREHLKLDDPLQVHTCKSGSPDQEFVIDGSSLKMPAYNRCLTVSSSGSKAQIGTSLLMRKCNGGAMQNFSVQSSGKISLSNSELCVAAGSTSLQASGPSHMWRVVSMQSCSSTDKKLITWRKH